MPSIRVWRGITREDLDRPVPDFSEAGSNQSGSRQFTFGGFPIGF
jgi:hypothetical protein